MINLLKAIFVGIVFSMYYFPFELVALPGLNTKMVLAVFGAVCFVWNRIKNGRKLTMDSGFVWIYCWALLFSLFSFASVAYNTTDDYAYATYIVSMIVWLSGAYAIVSLIRAVHGSAGMRLIFHYMVWVCAVQSVLGIMIDNIPSLQMFVDSVVSQNVEYLHKTHRLYGIGAYFDTAGIRFSCALLGLGWLLTHGVSSMWRKWYWLLFAVIVILGSVMSRTTVVGLGLSLVYMLIQRFRDSDTALVDDMKKVMPVVVSLAVLAIVVYSAYSAMPGFRRYFEYGFEGFINFFETGDWSTSSTDRLQSMVVFPDNAKTWLIGDGWFDDPLGRGFYMFTDVGYLRLIFYCGLMGLSMFIIFFMTCTWTLMKRYRSDRMLFVLMFILVLAVWVKISTDIFLVYALLLLLDVEDNVVTESIFDEIGDDTESDTLLLAER